LPYYLIGTFFGILYYEYNNEEEIKSDIAVDRTSYIELSNSSMSYVSNSSLMHERAGMSIKTLAKSNCVQNMILITFIVILMIPVVYDITTLFPKIQEDALYKYNIFEKIYTFMECDLIVIVLFFILWKFVIFQSSGLRVLLESSFWLPLSRSYFVVACLLCPITYYIILSINYPISFSTYYVGFLTVSVLGILLFMCFIINLILEVPMKVGFKKLFSSL
jgi:hypothetical protein